MKLADENVFEKKGIPTNEPKTKEQLKKKNVCVTYVDDETLNRFKLHCNNLGISLATQIRILILKFLEK